MRADNHGEGGIFALLAVVPEKLRMTDGGKRGKRISFVVVVGAALLSVSDSRLHAEKATYFLGREAILGHGTGMLGRFAEGIYAFMQRNAVAADRAFQIPPKQVVEVGIQLDV